MDALLKAAVGLSTLFMMCFVSFFAQTACNSQTFCTFTKILLYITVMLIVNFLLRNTHFHENRAHVHIGSRWPAA